MRILIVDNSTDLQKTYSASLIDEGHQAAIANNEREALNLITTPQYSFDFALVDLRLHDEDDDEDESGLTLAIAIKALRPTIQVILVSGHLPHSVTRLRGEKYFIPFFVEKSLDFLDTILQIIQLEPSEQPGNWRRFYRDTTRLSLMFESKQTIFVRGRGKHSTSQRTSKVLEVDVESYARQMRLAKPETPEQLFQIKNIGVSLWRTVFHDHQEVLNAYQTGSSKGKLLSLRFEGTPDFLRLPIELARPDKSAECLAIQHPVSRYICGASPHRRSISPEWLIDKEKLTVLIIASNTTPAIPNVDKEASDLKNRLTTQYGIYCKVEVRLITSEKATISKVRTEVSRRDYDILHYAGHAAHHSQTPDDSYLLFRSDTEPDEYEKLRATELKILLEDSEARLVYLSSCYGQAASGESAFLDNDFLGLGQAITKAGIPTVVGFCWPVSDRYAPEFALKFYDSLLKEGSPEVAMWRARRYLNGRYPNDSTWMSPILIHQE